MNAIYLGRYSNPLINDDLFYPCSISLGRPKFALDYRIVDELDAAKPTPDLLEEVKKTGWSLDFEEKLSILFRERSSKIFFGLRGIRLAAEAVGKTPVLLCFENVVAGEYCHRTTLAKVMREDYGLTMVELPDASKKKRN